MMNTILSDAIAKAKETLEGYSQEELYQFAFDRLADDYLKEMKEEMYG